MGLIRVIYRSVDPVFGSAIRRDSSDGPTWRIQTICRSSLRGQADSTLARLCGLPIRQPTNSDIRWERFFRRKVHTRATSLSTSAVCFESYTNSLILDIGAPPERAA